MFPPPANNDLSNWIGLLSAIGLPVLGLLFSQRKVLLSVLRMVLLLGNRLAQEKSPDDLPRVVETNGNGIHASIMQTLSAESKRTDSLEDSLDVFRTQIFESVEQLKQSIRGRLDSELVSNTMKFRTVTERLDKAEANISDLQTDVALIRYELKNGASE